MKIMKTIIISDITENEKSVIPYGLNIGKHTETKVDVLHIVDPMLQQGAYSSESDSQTFTPADKLSHEQIVTREKARAEIEIDKLLSKEGSRLNYPLRINVEIEVSDTENKLAEVLRVYPQSLIVTSTTPAKSMVNNLGELMIFAHSAESMILVIPPGYDFVKPTQGILVTDFSDEDCERVKSVLSWLKPFDPLLYACAFVDQEHDHGMEMQIKQWMELVNPFDNSSCIFDAGVMHGEVESHTLNEYVKMYNPSIVILPKNRNSFFGESLYTGNKAKEIIESLKTPVLLY